MPESLKHWPWFALAFALMHRSVFRFLPQGLLGLALGALAVRSRSLLPSVTLHLGYNLAIWGASPLLAEAIEAPIAWIALAGCLAIAAKLLRKVAPNRQFT